MPHGRLRIPGVLSLLWRSPAGMAVASVEVESAVTDVRRGDLTGAFCFSLSTSSVHTRVDVARMKQRGLKVSSPDDPASCANRARLLRWSEVAAIGARKRGPRRTTEALQGRHQHCLERRSTIRCLIDACLCSRGEPQRPLETPDTCSGRASAKVRLTACRAVAVGFTAKSAPGLMSFSGMAKMIAQLRTIQDPARGLGWAAK